MFLRKFDRQKLHKFSKWLTRLGIALLAAFFSASVSLAWGNGEAIVANGKEPIPNSQSPISNSQELLDRGKQFFGGEQFFQAAEVWQQAASNYKAAGDKLNEALALNYLSLAYQQLGKWQEAQNAIDASLSAIRTQGSPQILAQALNTQGHLQLALGQSEQALTTWQQAAKAYARAGDTEGEIGSQINQAQAMQNMGLYRRSSQTLEEIQKSLENKPGSAIEATGLRSLGNTLRVIGKWEDSRKALQKSLQIAQQLGDKNAISAAQFSLGNTARALARNAKESKDRNRQQAEIGTALKAYQEAAAITNSPIMRLQAQLNQLSLLLDSEQYKEAEALREQIQPQIQQLPPSRRSVYARINYAQSLIDLTKKSKEKSLNFQSAASYQDAASVLATAVQQAKSLKDIRAESYAVGNLAELYKRTGQSQESRGLTQQALSLAESIEAPDIAYRWEWQLGRLLKEQGDKKGAIEAYQDAVEDLKSLRRDLVGINPDNPDIEFSFRESVEPVYREFVDLLVTAENAPSQENLRQALDVIESLQIAELDNFFQEACLNAKPVEIEKLDTVAGIVYPIILPDKLAVILALPQSPLRVYSTSVPQSEIEENLRFLRQSMGKYIALAEESEREQVFQKLQQVYDWLIRPGEADLQQSKVETLVFVLDGLLRNIPMASLYDGQEYLIEKYSIAITPGLQLLPPQTIAPAQLRVLSVGLSEARQGFSRLPNVKSELQQIQRQVNSDIILNQQFTESNLQQQINSVPFPVVHIATHGQFSSQADKTFIITWDNKINVKDLDSLLRRRQQGASRPIELLVFSACQTAEGDNRAALGLAGVAVRAGARSTLATLWKVSDSSTAAVMVKFYQELAKGATKAKALQEAQKSLLKQRQFRVPFVWAPYFLVGNWR